jgi:hypothetical protein
MGSAVFEAYRQEMVGLRLSSIWQGHGSAIFLLTGFTWLKARSGLAVHLR